MKTLSKNFKVTFLARFVFVTFLSGTGYAWAENETIEFDSAFLMGPGSTNVDLSRYSDGNTIAAGVYDASGYVNNDLITTLKVEFVDIEKNGKTQACITPRMLSQLHIRQPDELGENAILLKREDSTNNCLNLAQAIPLSTSHFDGGDQRLDIGVPQIWVQKGFANYVDPSLWDNGIPAAMLSYNVSAWKNENSYGGTDDSVYAGFNGGINLGAWHFRTQGNYSWQKDGSSSIEFQDRYVQRDIAALRSQLVIGESSTSGESFDTVNFRGVRLYSESQMLPPQLASYAPTIRGVANSNAKVSITQNGYKIYETTVPPGPFVIDDLSPSGFGADLEVTITEADGSKHTFTQAFSSLVQMMHPGVGSWDFSVGQVNDDSLHDEPGLAQGTFYYGFNSTFTGFSGVQATDNGYVAGLLGVGMNTLLGAISFDVTQSQTDIPNDKTYRGQSYRVSWNKYFAPTDTSLNIAAYRYSTKDYLGLSDALSIIDDAENSSNTSNRGINNYSRMKNQFTISLNQSLQSDDVNYGSFYLNGSWADYWVTNENRSSFSAGYSNSLGWASYSVSLQRTYNEDDERDDSVYLSVTLPLDKLLGTDRNSGGFRTLNSSLSSDFDGGNQFNSTASGYSADNRWSYSVSAAYDMQKENKDLATVSSYVSYDSSYGNITASASASNDSTRQYSLNTDGGFVLHGGGLTFSNQSFGASDTLVLVDAPGAKGARIDYGNSTIDSFGYGIGSTLTPYRENTVSLDINELDNDIEMKSTSATVIPRRGAVVLSQFETDQGRSAIINLVRSDRQPVPFTAEVFDLNNNLLGTVGQGSQAFVRGISESGDLEVRWNQKNYQQRCRLHYQVAGDAQQMAGKTIVFNAVPCKMQ
ncbi:outer membrane usher protein [Salmonella enterica subsp. enterica]|nr:outer membrane usher protein [Salmonella enterica subsp. enterica]EDW9588870.1 outer membrane usher protein [Salmonella enterica subsp. enterica]EED9671611.1 outer membrane usher protein [Salmonella enterica subsp. enterica]EIO7468727.1 outer membrane usher protein [Salmonella enterica subsp. enterica]EIY5764473.1 outer membrane usher protein [Salmonella enterica subsp. enterica]